MRKNQKGFGAVGILIVLLVIALIGGIGWYIYDKNHTPKPTGTVVIKKTTATKKAATTPAATTISDALKENIAAAIESKNTAALEGYMADSVTVVIAASEKGGAETAAEAVNDLAYLNNGTTPWNFAIPAATLTNYKNGFYGQYFGDMTYVGQSANNYVVSFHVNNDGKIDKIFMSVNADLLV